MDARIQPLPIDPSTLRDLSQELIDSHYDNNYSGAVKRLNAIRAQLASLTFSTAPGFQLNGLKREELIATNSMLLHELYFASLGGDGMTMEPAWTMALEANFGSAERWRRVAGIDRRSRRNGDHHALAHGPGTGRPRAIRRCGPVRVQHQVVLLRGTRRRHRGNAHPRTACRAVVQASRASCQRERYRGAVARDAHLKVKRRRRTRRRRLNVDVRDARRAHADASGAPACGGAGDCARLRAPNRVCGHDDRHRDGVRVHAPAPPVRAAPKARCARR